LANQFPNQDLAVLVVLVAPLVEDHGSGARDMVVKTDYQYPLSGSPLENDHVEPLMILVITYLV
jgi:hypothetical protein